MQDTVFQKTKQVYCPHLASRCFSDVSPPHKVIASPCARTGLDADQAAVLADVLGGRFSIVPPRPQGASLGDILAFCRANANAAPHWEQMAALVDTASRMVANFKGVAPPPPLQVLLHTHIGAMLRKPVRARYGTCSCLASSCLQAWSA